MASFMRRAAWPELGLSAGLEAPGRSYEGFSSGTQVRCQSRPHSVVESARGAREPACAPAYAERE